MTPSMGGLSLCSLPPFRLCPPNLQSIFSPSGPQIRGVALPYPVQALLPWTLPPGGGRGYRPGRWL